VLRFMIDDSVLIMGFDILPSKSPRSKTAPKFACVIMRNGAVLSEYPEISRANLLRLTREIDPKWLCTDNIFEIIRDSKSLYKLVERLPHETRLVQVTGVPPRQVALKKLAKRHGLSVHGKPTPLESARLAAHLAWLGVGYSLECFGEQTEIRVTRGRKMGKGGQSANRYRRKIHSEIQQMTRFVESQLKTAGIEYDIDIQHSDFGYASTRIVAFAPLPAIRRLVERKRGGDFNVIISPVRKRTEFIPLEPGPISTQFQPRFFILGIDPGTTAAICLLSLDGRVHLLKSGKSFTRADIIRLVYEHGIPVMVATDVPRIPHFVEKIGKTLNAKIYAPSRPIPVADKQELARELSDVRIRNAHERDALTAAVYAYRSMLPKFQQIEHKVREEQIALDRSHLKALVLKGMSINEAISSLVREESEPVDIVLEPDVPEEELTRERFDTIVSKLDTLRAENRLLEERAEDLERLVEFLRFRESELTHSLDIVAQKNHWKIKRDREVVKKQSELKQAQRDIEEHRRQMGSFQRRFAQLRGVKHLEMRGDMLAVKVLEKFTQESIEEYITKVATLKHGDIVLFEDASGGGPTTAQMLIDRKIRAVIVDTSLSHLSMAELVNALIPVIDAKEVELKRVDEFAFINRKKFEHQFQEFMKQVQEQARIKGEDRLVAIVEKYKREIER